MIRNLLAVALAATVIPAAAQDYPAKPIQMLMPLQAGSAVDAMMRTME
jgi:tripartite-type tricarboxylate transporter receptor subunit TctC